MDCSKYPEKVELLLDGELTPDEKNEVLDHIAECQHCSNRYNADSTFKQTLREKLPRKMVSASLEDDIRNQINKFS